MRPQHTAPIRFSMVMPFSQHRIARCEEPIAGQRSPRVPSSLTVKAFAQSRERLQQFSLIAVTSDPRASVRSDWA